MNAEIRFSVQRADPMRLWLDMVQAHVSYALSGSVPLPCQHLTSQPEATWRAFRYWRVTTDMGYDHP